jgi:gas vesicle protein
MADKNNGNGGLFIVGVLVGSAIGAVAGLLVAPRSGKETRRILQKSARALPELAEDLSTTVQLQADRLSESARRNWDDTLIRLKEAVAAGIEASQSLATEKPFTDSEESPESDNQHSRNY